MLRTINKQSGKTVESVLKKKSYSGKDLQKRKVLSLELKSGGDGILIIITSTNVTTSTTTVWYKIL